MNCPVCDISVRKVLERVPGVVEARADNSSKLAEIRYHPGKVSAEQLAAALTRSGYRASVRKP